MRLIDLLRSRKQGERVDAVESTGAGFLREQDIVRMYENDEKKNTGLSGDIGERDVAEKGRKPENGVIAYNHTDSVNHVDAMFADWVDDPDDAHENNPECNDANDIHAANLSLLEDIYDDGMQDAALSIEALIEPLICLIDFCARSNTILRKAVRLKTGKVSFALHSLNAAIIAINVGSERKYSDERLFSLALCTLLGDIGMTQVDPDILEKTGKLTDGEYSLIQEHVKKSMQILSPLTARYPFLVPVIAQIHERENASGYPLGLAGEQIHEFAKIIGMCDVYSALTEPKVNREKYSGFVALQQIITRRGEDFNARIIKSLIEAIGLFPLESLVRLNNGLIGRVIEISRIHPTRPKLTVLVNADGEKISKPRLVDLEKEPLLYIEDPDIAEGIVLNA